MSTSKITVLIVENIHGSVHSLAHLLNLDPRIKVLGTVSKEKALQDFLQQNKPDLLLMEVPIAGMDAFQIIRRLMETSPLPIVACIDQGGDLASPLLQAGAIASVEKPGMRERTLSNPLVARMLQTVKSMSEVKVVRRWQRSASARPLSDADLISRRGEGAQKLEIVGIGASTGGPVALQIVLAGLPKDFPLPILIVQHITAGFLPGMAEWLTQATGMPVSVALHGVVPQPRHAYLAPDDVHMGIGPQGHITLSPAPPENGLRPSVSFLFHSLAIHCGPRALGVLLTGMGKDGAAELKQMKDCGAITIAQDAQSSVIHGMPGAAIALGAANYVLPLEKIASVMHGLVQNKNSEK